jgi:hypothetical protein
MERQRSPPREGTRPATVPVWPSLLHVAPSGGIPSNEVTPGTLLIRPLFAPCFFLFSVRSLSAGFYSVPRSPGISQIGGENEGISDASPSGSRCGKNSADFPEFFPNFFFEDARGSRNQGGGGGQDGRPTMARRRREAGGEAATDRDAPHRGAATPQAGTRRIGIRGKPVPPIERHLRHERIFAECNDVTTLYY